MKYISLTITLVCALFAVGCDLQPSAPGKVRIGLIAYLQDEHTETMGVPTLRGAQMAVEEINAAGGVNLGGRMLPVELVVENIPSNPQRSVAATRKLTNRDNVVAIIGPQHSIDAIPSGAFAEKAQIPLISPMSTNRETTAGRDYVFRMSFTDDLQGNAMALFARNELQARKAAVLYYQTDPYSSNISGIFKSSFEANGGRVVAYESFSEPTENYRPFLERIRAADPDVLYLPNFANDVLLQVRQARALGLNATLLGADGWDQNLFPQHEQFEDSFMTNHWAADMTMPEAQLFTRRFNSLHGNDPKAVAALTYDAFRLLFAAISAAGSLDGTAIREGIHSLPAMNGVTGSIKFSNSGDPEKGVVLLTLKNGESHFYKMVMPD